MGSSYSPQINCEWKKKKKFVMSVAIHHKINYKKLFESMLGSSYSREK